MELHPPGLRRFFRITLQPLRLSSGNAAAGGEQAGSSQFSGSHPAPDPAVYPAQLDSQSFRLLKIACKRLIGSKISCSLQSFSLEQTPPFSALSYTWGDAEDARVSGIGKANIETPLIYVNKRKFTVTRNLYDALLQLRKGLSTFIWIDAICINQNDVVEKSNQVSIMDRIYERADQTIVWLGPDTRNEAHRALEIIEKLKSWHDSFPPGEFSRLQDSQETRFSAQEVVQRAELEQLTTAPGSYWKALVNFLDRKWFFRTWIAQEVALAYEVRFFCGETEFLWADLVTLGAILGTTELGTTLALIYSFEKVQETNGLPDKFDTPSYLGMTLSSILNLYWLCKEISSVVYDPWCFRLFGIPSINGNMHAILTWLIYTTWNLQCYDMRDKIYGILGMVSAVAGLQNLDVPALEISYTKPAASVFCEVATYILRNSKCLGFLTFVPDISARLLPGLPSWVPEFGNNKFNPLFLHDYIYSEEYFDASHCYTTASIARPFYINNNILLCRSYIIGCVTHVSGPIMSYPHLGSSLKDMELDSYLNKVAEVVLSCAGIYFTGQDRVEVFWRTLIADTEGANHPAPARLADHFRHMIIGRVLNAHKIVTGKYFDEDYHKHAYPCLEALAKTDRTGLIPRVEVLREYAHEKELDEDAFVRKYLPHVMAFTKDASAARVGRSFFITDSGHTCLGPESVLAGDLVCILAGGPTPYVLRDKSDVSHDNSEPARRHTIFMGETYVHGVMHGEAMIARTDIPWQDVAIV